MFLNALNNIIKKVIGFDKELQKWQTEIDIERKEIIDLFEAKGGILKVVKGTTKAGLQDAADHLKNNNITEAISSIEKVLAEKIKVQSGFEKSHASALTEEIQRSLHALFLQSDVIGQHKNNGQIRSIYNKKKVHNIFFKHHMFFFPIYAKRLDDFQQTAIRFLPITERFLIHQDTLHPEDLFTILNKACKKYYKENLCIPKVIHYDKDRLIGEIENLEQEYATNKKIHQKEKYLEREMQNFLDNLFHFFYNVFQEDVREGIGKGKITGAEEIVAKFVIHCNDYVSKAELEEIPAVFENHILQLVESNLAAQKAKNAIALAQIESQPEKHKNNGSEDSANKFKNNDIEKVKIIPENIVFFAEQVSQEIGGTDNRELYSHIIRLYRNNKPIIAKRRQETFAIDDTVMEGIISQAEFQGFRVQRVQEETVTISTDIAPTKQVNDTEPLKHNEQNPLPKTSEDILDILKGAGLLPLNEKKLLKQIAVILIEKDRDDIMKKRLLFSLYHPISSRNIKKGKYKTIELGSDRLVVKSLGDKPHIIGLMNHDEYDTLLHDFHKPQKKS